MWQHHAVPLSPPRRWSYITDGVTVSISDTLWQRTGFGGSQDTTQAAGDVGGGGKKVRAAHGACPPGLLVASSFAVTKRGG